MLGDIVYQPPKNKYPQYTRSDFDILNYTHAWANHRDFLMNYDGGKTGREFLAKFAENPMYKHRKEM